MISGMKLANIACEDIGAIYTQLNQPQSHRQTCVQRHHVDNAVSERALTANR